MDKKLVAKHRTLWISDVHLGTRDCQAQALLDFLARNEAQTIYLVGDIIDGWQLKKRWYWTQAHNDVIQKLLRKARKGTRIVYITGNHDMFIRDYIRQLDEGKNHEPKLEMGGIEFVDSAVHTAADGRKIWILHGDLFDGVVQNIRWLAKLGDELYMLALKVNRWLNLWRARLGLEYWSLSQYLKDKVKNAVSYIDSFEVAVANEAKRQGCQAVLCGHIHRAQMREIDGILYLNSGDWVESMTAIVEDMQGALSLLQWDKHTAVAKIYQPVSYTPPQPAPLFTPMPTPAMAYADAVWTQQVEHVLRLTHQEWLPNVAHHVACK